MNFDGAEYSKTEFLINKIIFSCDRSGNNLKVKKIFFEFTLEFGTFKTCQSPPPPWVLTPGDTCISGDTCIPGGTCIPAQKVLGTYDKFGKFRSPTYIQKIPDFFDFLILSRSATWKIDCIYQKLSFWIFGTLKTELLYFQNIDVVKTCLSCSP